MSVSCLMWYRFSDRRPTSLRYYSAAVSLSATDDYTSRLHVVCGRYVFECIMPEENTYLNLGDWATGNALFRVS